MPERNTSYSEPRTFVRPNFGNPAELPIYETWFTDMAAEGMHLVHWGTWFCRFAQRNPKQTQYRIDLLDIPRGQKLKPPVHPGWSFICQRDDALVYRCDKPDAEPFIFDPRRRFSSLQSQKKNRLLFAVLFWILGALTVLLGVYNFSWRGFLTGGYGYFIAACVFVVCAVFLTIESAHLGRIYFRYKTRQEEKRPNWKRTRKRARVSVVVCTALFSLSVITLLAQGFSNTAGTLPFEPGETKAPLPWLEMLDENMLRVSAQSAKYYDTNNFIAQKWSLLAPRQYVSRQCGESKDGTYHPMISSESIRCLFSTSAKKLFNESATVPLGWEQIFAVDMTGNTEQIRLYTNEYNEYYLAARKGKNVLTVEYIGRAEPVALIEAARTALGMAQR